MRRMVNMIAASPARNRRAAVVERGEGLEGSSAKKRRVWGNYVYFLVFMFLWFFVHVFEGTVSTPLLFFLFLFHQNAPHA